MSFENSPLAGDITRRAGELVSADPRLSRDDIVGVLLAEDGETWETMGPEYQRLVSRLLLREV